MRGNIHTEYYAAVPWPEISPTEIGFVVPGFPACHN